MAQAHRFSVLQMPCEDVIAGEWNFYNNITEATQNQGPFKYFGRKQQVGRA